MAKRPSRLARLAKLGGLTSRVTGSYVVEKMRDVFRDEEVRAKAKEKLHVDNAREIVETVGRMKGAAMKLGQQLAVAASSLDLPDEVAATLGKLNADAEPVPFEQIRASVERELEARLDQAFASFDPTPLGTASLGQAHAATLHDGTEVVVKVLHDGVDENVKTDMLALRTVLLSGRVLRRDKAELRASFDEVQARLEEELDYLQEAANIYAFHELFGDDPRVRIPRVHTSLCTERILTMDRLRGVPIERFAAEGSPEAKQRAGITLTELYYQQSFVHRMLHADPHPGNYLFEPDGRVGLLDFGCVKRFDEFWIGAYARAALAIFDDDKQACLRACEDIGSWDGQDAKAGDALWALCQSIGTGYRMGELTLGTGHEQLLEDVRPAVRLILRHPQVKAPPHLIFLHRSLTGMYALSRRLELRADFGAIARPYCQYAADLAAGRSPSVPPLS